MEISSKRRVRKLQLILPLRLRATSQICQQRIDVGRQRTGGASIRPPEGHKRKMTTTDGKSSGSPIPHKILSRMATGNVHFQPQVRRANLRCFQLRPPGGASVRHPPKESRSRPRRPQRFCHTPGAERAFLLARDIQTPLRVLICLPTGFTCVSASHLDAKHRFNCSPRSEFDIEW